LVRQKPGFAKGVLFITIEDETGIANGILWPDRFEAQRRTIMSASMVGMKGRVQKEGEIIHVICDPIIDHGDLLHRVGDMSFPHRTGRGDAGQHPGSPDRDDKGWKPEAGTNTGRHTWTAWIQRRSFGSSRTTSTNRGPGSSVTSALSSRSRSISCGAV
jgi:DNA polymerase III alpha subunit